MFDIFESKGIKRTLASVFAFAAMIAPTIPVIAPYAEAIQLVAGWFGFAGVAHAAISKAGK
jgi:hypothetical protein